MKVKIQDSTSKSNFFFDTPPFNPWAILITWLHIGAFQKYKKNEFTIHFEQNSPWAHMELEFDVLGVAKNHVTYVIYLPEISKL